MEELLYTSASILDLLSNIDELSDKDISLEETASGAIIRIGESQYNIVDSNAAEVIVDPETIEEVDDVTSEAFEDLADAGVDVDVDEPSPTSDEDDIVIEGGPIKQIAKTLLLGGMLRLSAKLLSDKDKNKK